MIWGDKFEMVIGMAHHSAEFLGWIWLIAGGFSVPAASDSLAHPLSRTNVQKRQS